MAVDFSEAITASHMKVSMSRHLIEYNWPNVVYIQKIKLDFLRNYCADLNQILYESFQVHGNENLMT